MEKICHYCKEEFEGDDKFCSIKCKESHIKNLERIVKEAVENDPSHTTKISSEF